MSTPSALAWRLEGGEADSHIQEIARVVIAEAQRRSTNAKVRYQWERHLGSAYCGPLLTRPINEITTSTLLAS